MAKKAQRKKKAAKRKEPAAASSSAATPEAAPLVAPPPSRAHRWVARAAVALAAALAFGRASLHPLLDGWAELLVDRPDEVLRGPEHCVQAAGLAH